MTDRDTLDRTAADTRLTWTIGGALLVVSTLLTFGTPSFASMIPGGIVIGPACFAAAAVLFALGIRGAGSVTARRPLGTTALVFLSAWTLLNAALLPVLIDAVLSASNGGVEWTLALGDASNVILFAAALIAALQIARAAVVPRPWNWAPLWSLAAVTIPWVVLQIVGVGGQAVD